MESALGVVDKDACGDVHRIYQAQPFRDAAFRYDFSYSVGYIYEFHSIIRIEPEVFSVRFQIIASLFFRELSEMGPVDAKSGILNVLAMKKSFKVNLLL